MKNNTSKVEEVRSITNKKRRIKMKNYIEGLKRVDGGGDIQNAQKIIEVYYMTTAFCKCPKTIEEVSEHAENKIKYILKRFDDDVEFLKLKTIEQQNEHYIKYYKSKFETLEQLLDASYCIEWTINHQQRTITEIMDDYRNTNKITQADFDTLKNSGSFNSLELNHILMGLPVGLGSECIPAPKIKV